MVAGKGEEGRMIEKAGYPRRKRGSGERRGAESV